MGSGSAIFVLPPASGKEGYQADPHVSGSIREVMYDWVEGVFAVRKTLVKLLLKGCGSPCSLL